MARKNFKRIETNLLFIPALSRDEVLPKGSLPYIIDKFVEGLDLSELEDGYSDDGSSSYPPRALLKVILLAYCNNVYGCRPIADLVKYDMRYGYMCGYRHPSFNTINRFRSERLGLDGVRAVFKQLVSSLSGEGLIDIEDIYIDGTTVESRASRKRIVWRKTVRRHAESNKEKIEGLLEQVGIIQAEESGEGDGPEDGPSGGQRPDQSPHLSAGQTERLRKDVAKLPDGARKAELNERLDKADRYRREDQMCGERSGTATTDPESVAMHPKDDVRCTGPCFPMYDVMAASSNQFLVYCGQYGLTTDTAAYPYFLAEICSVYGSQLKSATADAAFGSEVNLLLTERMDIEPYFKSSMYDKEHEAGYKPDPFQPQNFLREEDGSLTCPGGRTFRKTGETKETTHGVEQTTTTYKCESCRWCRLKGQCLKGGKNEPRVVRVNERWWKDTKPRLDQRLDSDIGQQKLQSRSFQIEPCFAHIKWAGNYKRFRHFGKERCLMDLNLKALSVNLKKYFNKAKKRASSRLYLVKIWLKEAPEAA